MKKNWYSSALGRFRMIANCEGTSFLLLLLIAMPLKYLAHLPQAVIVVGWAHGVLFISYIFALLQVKMQLKWDLKTTATAMVASLVPFGPFILDKRILSREVAYEIQTK